MPLASKNRLAGFVGFVGPAIPSAHLDSKVACLYIVPKRPGVGERRAEAGIGDTGAAYKNENRGS